MIDGLKNGVTPNPHAEAVKGQSKESVESVALAGAAAIQRLIAERDNLRNCASVQQRDLSVLNAMNEDLRRRVALIRHHYVELGTRILTQLEQFDQMTRDAMQDIQGAAHTPREDANFVSLADRLKPNNGPSRSANEARGRER